MMMMEEMIEFLGWCSILNIGLLFVSAGFVIVFRESAVRIHAKLFAMEAEELQRIYFRYLAWYKIAVLIFNIVPYVALKIMN